jgi:hypothetical protein
VEFISIKISIKVPTLPKGRAVDAQIQKQHSQITPPIEKDFTSFISQQNLNPYRYYSDNAH